MDRPLTLRFPQAERAEIDQMAAAAGCSSAELIRRHWRQRGSVSLPEMNETLAGIGAVVVQLYERFDALEQRPPEPSAAPDLAPIAQRMERVERALNSLISAVEKLYQPGGVTTQRRVESVSKTAEHPGAKDTAAPGKRTAPVGGFTSWVREQTWAHNDETPQERARRLLPVYNAQFDPPHQLPGG